MAVSRKAVLRPTFDQLRSHFEKGGWRLRDLDTMLVMERRPSSDVEHTLLAHQTLQPPEGFLGLACTVNVLFPELEAAINTALDRDWRVSVHLTLSRLVPNDHVYLGNVHLIPTDADTAVAVVPMSRDFETYLEPVRSKLSTASVFSDMTYVPPGVGPWAWEMRRAVYCRLHARRPVWEELFARLNAQTEAVLATEVPNDPGRAFVFTDIRAVLRKGELTSAEDMRKLLAAMR